MAYFLRERSIQPLPAPITPFPASPAYKRMDSVAATAARMNGTTSPTPPKPTTTIAQSTLSISTYSRCAHSAATAPTTYSPGASTASISSVDAMLDAACKRWKEEMMVYVRRADEIEKRIDELEEMLLGKKSREE